MRGIGQRTHSDGDVDGFLLHIVLHVGALDYDPPADGGGGGRLAVVGAGLGRRRHRVALPRLLAVHSGQGRQMNQRTGLLFLVYSEVNQETEEEEEERKENESSENHSFHSSRTLNLSLSLSLYPRFYSVAGVTDFSSGCGRGRT